METKNIIEVNLIAEIYNLQGKLIFQQIIENPIPNNKFPLTVILPSGIYLCKVKYGSINYSQKIEIVR